MRAAKAKEANVLEDAAAAVLKQEEEEVSPPSRAKWISLHLWWSGVGWKVSAEATCVGPSPFSFHAVPSPPPPSTHPPSTPPPHHPF